MVVSMKTVEIMSMMGTGEGGEDYKGAGVDEHSGDEKQDGDGCSW